MVELKIIFIFEACAPRFLETINQPLVCPHFTSGTLPGQRLAISWKIHFQGLYNHTNPFFLVPGAACRAKSRGSPCTGDCKHLQVWFRFCKTNRFFKNTRDKREEFQEKAKMMTKKHAGKGGKEEAKTKRVCEDDRGGEKKMKAWEKIGDTETYSYTKYKTAVTQCWTPKAWKMGWVAY